MDTLLSLALGAARGLHLASTMVLAGTILFHAAIAPLPLSRWTRALLPVVLASLGAWLVLQAALIAGVANGSELLKAVPEVALHTRIGQVLLARGLLLLMAGLLTGGSAPRIALALPCALSAMVMPVAASHAAALGDGVLVFALAIHLLAATAWLGGLPALWHVVADPVRSLAQRQQAGARFSRLGLAAVLLLAVTAFLQAQRLGGDLAGLFGTPYGQAMLGKTALFLALLGLAALNRFILMPRMAGRSGLAWLRRTILMESILGIAVIGMAALLSATPPALHQQPVWPFPWRVEIWEWRPVSPAVAAGLMALPALLLLAGWRWPRRRWSLAGAALMVFTGYAAAGLRPDLVPATPTTFQTAPAGFSTAAILRGQVLATTHQALQQPMPSAMTEGDAFWLAGEAVPALSPAQRWDAAAFLRAAWAGEQVRQDGGWLQPLQAPDMQLLCHQRGGTTLSALRGTVLRLAAGFAPAVIGALTISLDGSLGPGIDCAADSDALRAYALLAGVQDGRSTGLWLLVDGHGWLRGSGFNTIPEVLEEAARSIGAAPLAEGRAHH
jgi:putative copper export protein